MANSSKTALVAGIGVAVAVLLFLNVQAQNNDPMMQKRAEAEKQAEDAKKAEANSKASPGGSPAHGPASPEEAADSNKLSDIGEETILGKKDGKTEFVIGFEWTPEVQADPSSVYKAIATIQKAAPDARIRVVNRDLDSDVPWGITQNGKPIAPAAPNGTFSVDARAIQAAAGVSSPPEMKLAPGASPAAGGSPAPSASPSAGASPAPSASPSPKG